MNEQKENTREDMSTQKMSGIALHYYFKLIEIEPCNIPIHRERESYFLVGYSVKSCSLIKSM